MDPFAMAGMGGLLGLGLGAMGPNSSGAYDNYANQMFGLANKYNPWIDLGWQNQQAASQGAAYNASNPTGMMNQIASTWQTSPYQQNILNKTTGMMNANNANTGMLGSQSANYRLGNELNNMTGQFQQQYIDNGLNQYNRGLGMQQQLGAQGLGALGQQTNLMQEGYLGQVQGANANAQHYNGMMGDAMGMGMMGFGLGGGFGGMGGSQPAGYNSVGGYPMNQDFGY